MGLIAPTVRAGGGKEAPEEWGFFDCYATPTLGDWLLLANLSCLAFLSVVYQRQIFLVVKKCSFVHQGPLCKGGIVYPPPFYIFPLSLLQL